MSAPDSKKNAITVVPRPGRGGSREMGDTPLPAGPAKTKPSSTTVPKKGK